MSTLESSHLCKTALLLMLTVGIISCQKGGIVDADKEPPEISSEFKGEDISFIPGEIRLIQVEGHTLQQTEYEAEIEAGQNVVLYKYSNDAQNKTLLFFVPEAEVENHVLLFTLGDQEQRLSFSIEEYEVIEDPNQYISDKTAAIIEELNAVIEQTEDGEVKDNLRQSVEDLNGAMGQFAELSLGDQRDIARLISASYQLSSSQPKQKSAGLALASCETVTERLLSAPERVLTIVDPTSASETFFSSAKTKVVRGFSKGRLKKELSNTIDDLALFMEQCVTPEYTIESNAEGDGSPFIFDHSVSQEFNITYAKTLPDAIKTALNDLEAALEGYLAYVPDKWESALFETDDVTVGPADTQSFNILQISDSRIEGELSSASSSVSLAFAFNSTDDMPVEALAFTFEIGDAAGSVGAEASLNPAKPIAYEGQFGTDIFTAYTDTLSADYAGSFAIVAQPEHGTLVLVDEAAGIFEYTPDDVVMGGTDRFSFTATNSAGTSEEATVTVELVNPFEGTWVMESFEDGVPKGEFTGLSYAEACDIVLTEWTLTQETVVIGTQSWSVSGNYRVKNLNLTLGESCSILEDGLDVTEDYPYSESGTYTRNGTLITTVLGDETVTGEAAFVSENKIKIGKNTYVRN